MRRAAGLVLAVALLAAGAWLVRLFVEDSGPKELSTRVAEKPRVASGGEISGALAGTAVVEQIPAKSVGAEPPQPPGDFPIATDRDGEAVWLSGTNDPTILRELVRWKPGTGSAERYRLSEPSLVFAPGSGHSVAVTPFGLLILGGKFFVAGQWLDDGRRLVLLDAKKNQVMVGQLHVGRERPYFLVLRDKSVIVASGVKISTNAVERIFSRDGELKVEPLPDLPGEFRRGVSLVELSDGRVMALGGSTSQYVGYEPMLADTFILDLAAKKWSAGPRMMEARTNATATLLPDGRVLVAGGWAGKHTWNDTATRSTELLSPSGDRFSAGAELVIGVAGHQAMWVPGQRDKQLLVAGGFLRGWSGNNSVQAYDVDKSEWRSIGECASDFKTGDVAVVPFSLGGGASLWCKHGGEPGGPWSLVSLRIPTPGAEKSQRIDAEAGIALKRQGLAFLSPQGNSPGLAVGGAATFGAQSAAVDAVWSDGRMQSMASLAHARTNAQVFRLQDGSILVTGGVSGDRTQRTERVPPAELLPLPAGAAPENARWTALDMSLEDGAILGQLGDGSLIALEPGGDVERWVVTGAAEGRPAVQRTSFPSLNRGRKPSRGEDGTTLVVKALSDGRIVVAGGDEQPHRIAVLHEDALKPDAPDQFVGIGDYGPGKTHEIYDPAAKVWRESAPSRGAGGRAAVLDDGRVVKWGSVTAAPAGAKSADQQAAEVRGILEISSADGKSWRELEGPETIHMVERRPFTIEGELFLSGHQVVQWFDAANRRWLTIWSAPGNNTLLHLGRIVVRDLPGGKRVVLPVAGL